MAPSGCWKCTQRRLAAVLERTGEPFLPRRETELTRHQSIVGWAGFAKVDGSAYVWMGSPAVANTTFSKATQKSLKVRVHASDLFVGCMRVNQSFSGRRPRASLSWRPAR